MLARGLRGVGQESGWWKRHKRELGILGKGYARSISVFTRRATQALTPRFISSEECEVSLFSANASQPGTFVSLFNGQTNDGAESAWGNYSQQEGSLLTPSSNSPYRRRKEKTKQTKTRSVCNVNAAQIKTHSNHSHYRDF